MITTVPFDVLSALLKYVDPVTEDRLIRSNVALKNAILLEVRQNQKVHLSGFDSPYARLFNITRDSSRYRWFASSEEITRRLKCVLDGFDDLCHIPNVVLAGGSLMYVLDDSGSAELPGTSDLDFFIFGEEKEKMVAVAKILQVLEKYSPRYFARGHVIDVLIPGRRAIQIIVTRTSKAYQVVENFDLGYVQIFLKNGIIWATHLAVVAFRDRKTVASTFFLSASRVQKARRKNFEFVETRATKVLEDTLDVLLGRFTLENLRVVLNSRVPCPLLQALPCGFTPQFIQTLCSSPKLWYGQDLTCVPSWKDIRIDDILVRRHGSDHGNIYHAQYADMDLSVITSPMYIENHYPAGGNFDEMQHSTVFAAGPFNSFYRAVRRQMIAHISTRDGVLLTPRDEIDDDTALRVGWEQKTVVTDTYGRTLTQDAVACLSLAITLADGRRSALGG